MKVLLLGSGGREHALAWRLAKDSGVSQVFVAPGNPGIALEPKVICKAIALNDFAAIRDFCGVEKIEFVVVGPDQALADGVVDFLAAAGIPAFGPKRAAARIEWSKGFAKEVMAAAGIPTARCQVFSDFSSAEKFLKNEPWGAGWVVKADGLALGKGVVVASSREQALAVASNFLSGGEMGQAGKTIVVEERLSGREVSAFFLCDGAVGVPLGFACDYKRLLAGDEGPNTGGMGAFSPVDNLAAGFSDEVSRLVVGPLLEEMRRRGTPFQGVLFVGLMLTTAGPKVIEFNSRFGDPETQVLMPLLACDLLPWLQACQLGRLGALSAAGPTMSGEAAVHVVMAAAGYPGTGGQVIRRGDEICIPESLLPGKAQAKQKLFFAGVGREQGAFHTNGGRVLGVTALGASKSAARAAVMAAVDSVKFAGAQWRADVGA